MNSPFGARVTYVASPNELSGRLVASAAFEPEVAKFIEDVTSGADDGHDLQQYQAGALAGLTVGEVREKLFEIDGPLLIAVAHAEAEGHRVFAHPEKSRQLGVNDHLIVLATRAQSERLSARYKSVQGRTA